MGDGEKGEESVCKDGGGERQWIVFPTDHMVDSCFSEYVYHTTAALSIYVDELEGGGSLGEASEEGNMRRRRGVLFTTTVGLMMITVMCMF